MWNSSEAFYEVVSTSPLDSESVAQAQYWLEAVLVAQRRVESSLGEFPGLSPRAAGDLQSLSRLLGPIGSAMGSLESALADAAGPAAEPGFSVDSLRREAQLVANDLVTLIGKAGDAGRGRPARDAIVTELTDLLERVQSFSRLLSTQPSPKALQESFRIARRQMWRVEGRITRLEWRAGIERPWRDVREKLNAVSNELGLPRVIELTPALPPLAGPERAIAAHVDHAVAWLDEFLAANGQRLGRTADGPRFVTDVVGPAKQAPEPPPPRDRRRACRAARRVTQGDREFKPAIEQTRRCAHRRRRGWKHRISLPKYGRGHPKDRGRGCERMINRRSGFSLTRECEKCQAKA